MTKDEALKLALEALEYLATQIKPDYEHSKAITAIKAALANEALERKAENARELGLDYYVPCCTDKTCSKCKAALEAKDEPVANNWSVFNTGAEVWEKLSLADAVVELTPSRLERGWSAVCVINKDNPPLTQPQRTWVGMTIDEREQIQQECFGKVPHHVAFAHAIEAKLKELNT